MPLRLSAKNSLLKGSSPCTLGNGRISSLAMTANEPAAAISGSMRLNSQSFNGVLSLYHMVTSSLYRLRQPMLVWNDMNFETKEAAAGDTQEMEPSRRDT